MIEESQYKFPRNQEQDKPKEQADPSTLTALEALPWRPFGIEW
jgi:hypothetical protein